MFSTHFDRNIKLLYVLFVQAFLFMFLFTEDHTTNLAVWQR